MYELTGNGFVMVTREKVRTCIEKARSRIVYAKPAFYGAEMRALIAAAERGIICDVYFDRGDISIRRGFGEAEALKCIRNEDELPETFHYHLKNRIRLAFLIVDDTAIVFAPNISAFENESEVTDFPNGIMCKGELAKETARLFIRELVHPDKATKTMVVNLGSGEDTEPEQIQTTVTVNQPEDPEEKQKDLDRAIEILEVNPAVKPEELQKTLIYTDNYKIMKVAANGIQINNKKIPLRPFYDFIGVIPKNAIREWSIMTYEEKQQLESTKRLEKAIDRIKKEYKDRKLLFEAKKHGTIIDATVVREFAEKLEKEKDDFIRRYRDKDNTDVTSLQKVLNDSEDKLRDELFKHCSENFEAFKTAIGKDPRYAKFLTCNAKMTMITAFLNETDYLHTVLKFPTIESIIDNIEITFAYYDIANETLADENFAEVITRNHLEPRNYKTGFTRINDKKSN